MKFKKLKKITIGAETYDITWDKESAGGSFHMGTHEIEIGTKYGEEDAFQILCHELLEICYVVCNQRYDKPDHQGNYLFCFDHSGFTTATDIFVGVLKQFIL